MWLWNITSTVYLPPATPGFCPFFLFKYKEHLKIHSEYGPSASDVQTLLHHSILKIQIQYHLPSRYPTFTFLINLIKKTIIAFQWHNLLIRLGADVCSSQLLVTPAVQAHIELSHRCSQYKTQLPDVRTSQPPSRVNHLTLQNTKKDALKVEVNCVNSVLAILEQMSSSQRSYPHFPSVRIP